MTSMRYSPPGRASNDAVMPHHAVVFCGSTRTCQTVSGLASIAIVRSTAVSVLLAMLLPLLSFCLAFQHLEPLAPEVVEESPPLDEPFGPRAVETSRAVAPLIHEPCLLQHGQMLGDRRPRHVEVRRDLAGGPLLVPHEPEDPAPVRGGDRLERGFHRRRCKHIL